MAAFCGARVESLADHPGLRPCPDHVAGLSGGRRAAVIVTGVCPRCRDGR
jgi:hypothetical protein